jgi:hypothetical protein
MVTELECNDPGCVPIETLVALIGDDARWTAKVLKPISDVTQQDIRDLDLPVPWEKWVIASEQKKNGMKIRETVLRESEDVFRKISELPSDSDKLLAIAVLQEKCEEIRRSIESFFDAAISVPMESRNDIALNDSAEVTMVPMKPRTAVSAIEVPKEDLKVDYSSSGPKSSSEQMNLKAAGDVKNEVPSFSVGSIRVANPLPPPITFTGVSKAPPIGSSGIARALPGAFGPPARHEKGSGVRPRGCPCCDPDNVDNIVDKLLFLETPP